MSKSRTLKHEGRPDENGRKALKQVARRITIDKVAARFERESLVRRFGFKGNFMTEIVQTASYLRSASGLHKIGLCTQNVLWSDAEVYAAHSERGGNALMFALTEKALAMIDGQHFTTPIELLDRLLPALHDFGKAITGNPQLRKTFALNALVGVDNAVWLLYASENNYNSFDEMIPSEFRAALEERHDKVAAIPLVAYNIPVNEIENAIGQGYFFMKMKIGQPGTQEEMLAKDIARITSIHDAIGGLRTPHTEDGKIPYYFDANGRYERKETLLKLLDHTRKIGAFDQIAIIEEPFPEAAEFDVSDIPARLAADESAHTDEDATKRIGMGYKAIALKPIAKTLSMTLKIAQAAYDRDTPCFCADLTVNPILVEWNKNVAGRLKAFPGMGAFGLLESNGHQNYRDWDRMLSYHPRRDSSWVCANGGFYHLNDAFYTSGGGIFDSSMHYEEKFGK